MLPTQLLALEDTKPVEVEDDSPVEYKYIILQGLNKVTGRISKLEGPIGTVLNFGSLEIIARRCWKAPADERPENATLLEVRELKQGEAAQTIFLGWMFSSTPGLSGLEHAVYDINVLTCEVSSTPDKSADQAPAQKNGGDTKKTQIDKPTQEKKK
jgi:hypothetical protein